MCKCKPYDLLLSLLSFQHIHIPQPELRHQPHMQLLHAGWLAAPMATHLDMLRNWARGFWTSRERLWIHKFWSFVSCESM